MFSAKPLVLTTVFPADLAPRCCPRARSRRVTPAPPPAAARGCGRGGGDARKNLFLFKNNKPSDPTPVAAAAGVRSAGRSFGPRHRGGAATSPLGAAPRPLLFREQTAAAGATWRPRGKPTREPPAPHH